MKATKKIVGAACALVAAVALSAGSTFAWFSTNSTVTAKGLTLGVDTSTEFLVIKGNLSAAPSLTDFSASDTSFNFDSTNNAKLKPSAHKAFNKDDLPGENTSWYYKTADASDGSGSTKAEQEISSANFSKYVWKETVYITMLPDKTTGTPVVVEGDNLTVTEIKVGEAGENKLNSAITVVLVCGNNVIEYKWDKTQSKYVYSGLDASTGAAATTDPVAAATPATALTNAQLLAAKVKSDAITTVDIYVYYDGDNSEVFTDNVAKLEGATIDFKFELVPTATT